MNTAHRILNKSIAALCAAISLSIITTVSAYVLAEETSEPTVNQAGAKTMLTSEEENTAKMIGFDPQVLLLIKRTLAADLAPATKGGLDAKDAFETSRVNLQELLTEQDRESYLKIKHDFPELAPVVDGWIAHYDQSQSSLSPDSLESQKKLLTQQIGEERAARYIKYQKAIMAYDKVLNYLNERGEDIPAGAYLDPRSDAFGSDVALDKAITVMQTALEKEKKRIPAEGTPYLSIRFWGNGSPEFTADARISELREQLQNLGYRITDGGTKRSTAKIFDSSQAAKEYLRERGTAASAMTLQELPSVTYPAIYPVEAKDWSDPQKAEILAAQSLQSSARTNPQMLALAIKMRIATAHAPNAAPAQLLCIPPGAVVRKTGEKTWSISAPPRFIAIPYEHFASIVKANKASPGFELVQMSGTSGVNYDVSNQIIIDKLARWNEQYGIEVTEASRDSITVKFKNLPEDLSEVCTESFLFCPDVVDLQGNENAKAARLRDFANELRQNHEIKFWWD